MTRLLTIICLAGAVGLLTLAPALAAVTGTEAAIIAGAAAGAYIVPPAVSQAMTYSKLEVKVEAYTETFPLARDPNISPEEWLKLPLEQRRSPAFSLGGPSALYRAMSQAAASQPLTTATAMLVAEKLEPVIGDFQTVAQQSKTAADTLLGLGKPFPQSLTPVLHDFQVRHEAATNVVGAILAYRDLVIAAMKDLKMEPAELAQAEERLGFVRLLLRTFPKDFEPTTADLFFSQVRAAILDASSQPVAPAPTGGKGKSRSKEQARAAAKARAEEQARADAAMTNVLARVSPPEQGTPRARMAEVVARAAGLLRQLNDNGGEITVAKTILRLDAAALKASLGKLVQAFGFTVPWERLLLLRTGTEVDALLGKVWMQVSSGELAAEKLTLTYVGLTIGANVGPLVNEVFQGIFSRGNLIDSMMEEDKWKVLNQASSISHAGDHNAIIYFDTLLTPVLKSATFDPSQFIAANAQLYKRVTGALADVFGLPVPPGAGSTEGVSGANLYDLKARKANADRRTAQNRDALLTTLNDLLELHNALRQSAHDNWTWNGADAAARQQAAAQQLQAVKDKLAALTQRLQNVETSPGP